MARTVADQFAEVLAGAGVNRTMLAMSSSNLSGRGDEGVDFARTNLWR
jgi:hypothetical protein